jgi:Teichoic acid biosynthesis proteins
MDTTIKIMDLDINMISMDTFLSKINDYLTNEYLNVILLASATMLEEAANDSEYREMLSRADLILPGDETLLSMHHVDLLKVAGMVINYKCIDQMLKEMTESKTAYLIARNEQEAEKFNGFCESQYTNIKLVGSCSLNLEQNGDMVINEINSLAPDILVVAVDTPFQESWMIKNCTKMNAKLCIGLGGVINELLEQYKRTPAFFRVLHLEKLYNMIVRNKRLNKIRQARIFKRKIAHYKNSKND